MSKYALIHANILSGKKNMILEKDKIIIVKDSKIISITNDYNSIKGMKIIDLNGKYVLPGLINLHVHLPGSGMPKDTKKQNKESVNKLLSNPLTRKIVYLLCQHYAKMELLSGVTTIRTVGGLANIDTQIRDNINKGKVMGPRILASNMAISVPGGHMAGVLAYEATSPVDGAKYVDLIAKDKPDLIKLMITGGVLDATKKGEPGEMKMSPEIVKACCTRAHELGFKVAAHVESPMGVKVAVENGVDTIEHGGRITDDVLEVFKKRKASHVLTLSAPIPLMYLPIEQTHGLPLHKYNSTVVFDGMIQCAKELRKNGLYVGLGTDTACPYITHYDMWREINYFHNFLDVSNEEAIYTATLLNATIAGIEKETGSIEVGKFSDMLIVENNPLEDLSCLRKPFYVIYKGKIIKNPRIKKYDIVEKSLDKFINTKEYDLS
ncbi:MAG: amidohydrolase family protein [Bacilli bacterium]|nr:amidohydrolase family protein [Bacilli bacterium]